MKKHAALLLSGLAIVGLAFGATLVLPGATQASGVLDQAAPGVRTFERGAPGEVGGFPFADRSAKLNEGDTYLADALGITTDALAAAHEAAGQAVIQQAVDEGLLTQEQADTLQSDGRFGSHPFPGGRMGFGGTVIDHDALLANALDIPVETLQAAQKTAAAARLEQAIADGKITQEQADLKKAHQALEEYLVKNGVFEQAVGQAVEAGVITQEQADAILANQGGGHGRPGMGHGRFGMRGKPGMHGKPGMGGFPMSPDGTTAPQGSPAAPAA